MRNNRNKAHTEDKNNFKYNSLGSVKIFYENRFMSFLEWLNYYGSIDNFPLDLFCSVVATFELSFKNFKGKIKLFKEIEV